MGLSPRQALALKRSTATINLWDGSVRSSKTIGSLWWWLARCAQHEGRGTILVVARSLGTAWRNLFVPLFTEPQFAPVAPEVQYRQHAPSGTVFGNEFYVVGASDEASWLRIQGMTVAICLGDEAAGWPQSFWDMLESRLTLDDSTLLATCNPGSRTHYLRDKVIGRAEQGDPDYHHERFLLDHNPFVSPKVKDRLRRSYTGVFRQRMIEGLWVSAEGAVYDTWDPDTMTTGDRAGTIIAVGIDYGIQHPTAGYALLMQDDGRLTIGHEWSPNPGTTRLTDAQLADSLEAWLDGLPNPPRFIYVDPSALSLRQELKTRGLPTHAAKNEVVAGIQTVHTALTEGRLKIHTSCRHLIDEIPSYMWDATASQRGTDKPVKENDDHVDALRYTVYSCRHLWQRTAWQTAAQSPA